MVSMISLLLIVVFPSVLGQTSFVPWNYGLNWNKVTYAGPGSDAMDLAWRAARGNQINQIYQNPLMPTQVARAQQSGLQTTLEAVYVEAICAGVNTAANSAANFDFVTIAKCYAKPLGKRSLWRVTEDKTPGKAKIAAMKVRDVAQLEIVLG